MSIKCGWLMLVTIILSALFCLPAVADNNKIVVLTFDDGPRPEILKEFLPLLAEYDIPGTFFVQGCAVSQNKTLVKKMHDAGHEIENHSYGHENLIKIFPGSGMNGIKKTIQKSSNEIFEATGRKPKFFRPPYWAINQDIENNIKSWGYIVMKLDNPDINTMDYADASKNHPAKILIERVKKIISAREKQGKFTHILVFHELPITVKALKTLIPYFQNQQYRFGRLDCL